MLTADNPSRWFAQPLLQKLLMALLLLACLLLLVVNEQTLRSNSLAFDDAVQSRQSNVSLQSLMQSVISAESTQRSYLLTQDEHYRNDFLQHMHNIDLRMAQLQTNPAPGVLESQRTLLTLVRDKQVIMRDTVAFQASGKRSDWEDIVHSGRGRQLMLAIEAQAAHVLGFNNLRLQRYDMRLRESMQMARLVMGGMILLTIGVLGVLWRQTAAREESEARAKQQLFDERNQLEITVQQRTHSLRELAANLQFVREDERAHLARELHDELGALLTAAKFDVARLRSHIKRTPATDTTDMQRCLQHLSTTLNEGIALKRRIIEDLTPSSLANLGLTTALENLTRDYAETSGIALHTHFDQVALSQTNALTAYRLIQEALTNIGKYANARNVQVEVTEEEGFARIVVQDDGCGFDTAQLLSGLGTHGLAGMQHRVENQQGHLALDSAPGNGTRISALLPLENTPSSNNAIL